MVGSVEVKNRCIEYIILKTKTLNNKCWYCVGTIFMMINKIQIIRIEMEQIKKNFMV